MRAAAFEFPKRILRSAIGKHPSSDRDNKRFLLSNLVLHFRPTTVPEPTLNFTLTWGLGGMAAVLVVLQLMTGILLKFVYVPIPVEAYASILTLQQDVLFGKLIRNVHYWCANLLVLVVWLHFVRVYLTGAFHTPRQFNWVVGLGLFSLILGANFTGYLLPWDQLAYWAVTICTGMLDYLPGLGPRLARLIKPGPEIGPDSLKLFYALHTAVLPGLMLALMAFHFWRVRKAGGLVVPAAPGNDAAAGVRRVATVPNLVLRELVVALVLTAAVLLLAVFWDAPLGAPANPGLSPNPTKAPWYFAGVQELLLHFHPTVAVWVIPLLLLGFLIMIPYIDYDTNTAGIWFTSRKGWRTACLALAFAVAATATLVGLDECLINGDSKSAQLSPVSFWRGVLPLIVCLTAVSGLHLAVKKRFSVSNNEAVQTVFVFLVSASAILTAVGIWLRGPAMALIWPWNQLR